MNSRPEYLRAFSNIAAQTPQLFAMPFALKVGPHALRISFFNGKMQSISRSKLISTVSALPGFQLTCAQSRALRS